MSNPPSVPYVVLLGDVGTGKSTLVEKLTNARDISSQSNTSFTRVSQYFYSFDRRLIICDTPGSNAMEDKFGHNAEIAAALNYARVARIFIIVKADTRQDCVVDSARKYADNLVSLPLESVAVIVTHMDTVSWNRNQFVRCLDNELGIDSCVFSAPTVSREQLQRDILTLCRTSHDIRIDSDNFWKIFKIHNHHRRILAICNREVDRYRKMKEDFDGQRGSFKEIVDLVLEFQKYMADELTKAQQRFSAENNFQYIGPNAMNEQGHLANMTNQMLVILSDVRTEAAGYQSSHGVQHLRKCPHCGLIWTKTEGCDGATKCGNRPNPVEGHAVFANFTFLFVGERLTITKSGERQAQIDANRRGRSSVGCGRDITWKDMTPFQVPAALSEAFVVSTNDMPMYAANGQTLRRNVDSELQRRNQRLQAGQAA